ncbi:glycoside hydrolase superfamily [Cladochytrium replicatum]|nr:glycoside hydrolase superfamily [Cladochytrium replicatum]
MSLVAILLACLATSLHFLLRVHDPASPPSISNPSFDVSIPFAVSALPPLEIPLFPRPKSISLGATTRRIALPIALVFPNASSPRVERAWARYSSYIFGDLSQCPTLTPSQTSGFTTLSIALTSSDSNLTPSTDESYSIRVSDKDSTIQISAATSFGALRAIETLYQLIRPNITGYPPPSLSSNSTQSSCAYFNLQKSISRTPIEITDAPRFGYRGVLIDSSRHYLTLSTIRSVVDGLSFSKMNVLHWHIVDSQSFPVQSESLPDLVKGAYSPFETYTKQDIASIIEYAMDRGVRIIPEFDMPGHTFAWGIGYPDLITCGAMKDWWSYAAQPPSGQLDLSKNETYTKVATLLREMATWFPDQYFHLGMDEVNDRCYTSHGPTQDFMRSHSLSSLSELIQYLQDHAVDPALGTNKTRMFWEEAVLDFNIKLPNDTVIQVWRDASNLKRAVDLGYSVVASPKDYLYLDCGRGDYMKGGTSWCDPYKTWQRIYAYDPLMGLSLASTDPPEWNRVIGGTACMWGELTDSTNLITTLFPRVSVLGERLWSDRNARDAAEAQIRLYWFRNSLVRRGVGSMPIFPEYCRIPGSC